MKKIKRAQETPAIDYDAATKKKRLASIISRGKDAIVIPPSVKIGARVDIDYDDLSKLGVDERYQRPEQRPMVNQIVRALRAGGQIADAIHVAVRTDGTWWIVDGQQRWNAAILGDAKTLSAQLYHVPDFDTEKKLFLVFNTRAKVHPNVIVKSWPGAAGDLVRWLNEDEESPLRGGIGFGPGNHATHATVIVKALSATLTGATRNSDATETSLRRLDAAIRQKGMTVARQYARSTGTLLKSYFNGSRMLASQVLPITGAAFEKWRKGVKLPTRGDYGRLHRMDWSRFAAPSLAQYAQKEVEKRWRS